MQRFLVEYPASDLYFQVRNVKWDIICCITILYYTTENIAFHWRSISCSAARKRWAK